MSGSVISLELNELENAAELVHRVVPPTPQYAWPKLKMRAGCQDYPRWKPGNDSNCE